MRSSATPAKPRLDYIDNLRICLTVLVVCHHVAIGVGGPGLWYYRVAVENGPLTTLVLATFIAVNQAFFMSLFFAISAFFTPRAYDKKGPRRFLADRCLRLALPLGVFCFGIQPALIWLSRYLSGTSFPARYWDACGTGPLWFVLALLIFSLGYVLVRQCGVSPQPRSFPTNRSILAFIVLMAGLAFVSRLWFPIGATVWGLQLGFFPLYVGMYLAGIWAYRNDWLQQLPADQVQLWSRVGMVGVALFPCMMAAMQLSGALDAGLDVVNGGFHWQAAVFACWEPVVCVGVSLQLLAWFQTRYNMSNQWTRFLSASAYTVYILHPFFVIVATWLVWRSSLPTLVAGFVISLLAVPSCFVVAYGVRSLPLLRRIL